MREYLFRGKRKDNGEWVEGDLLHTKTTSRGIITEICTLEMRYEVDPETVGQYTGVTDKNGKKIFEGDIVKVRFWSDWSEGYEIYDKCLIEYRKTNANFSIEIKPYAMHLSLKDHPEIEVQGG